MRAAVTLLLAFLLLAPASGALAPAGTPILADDAGSGRDAPDTIAAAMADPLIVQPGVLYTGYMDYVHDKADIYSVALKAGDHLVIDFAGPVGCVSVYRPDGSPQPTPADCTAAYTSLGSLAVDADVGGLWYVEYSYLEPQVYRFSLGIGGAGPSPYLVAALPTKDDPLPPVTVSTEAGPHTVVAVIDTGGNPYHRFFRAPALVDAPSTWLPGFPSDATPVNLSLGAPDVATAMAADSAKWNAIQRSSYDATTGTFTTHLYTFPGTRVVGAVSFSEYNDLTGCMCQGTIPVWDEIGHGSHSLGLAAGANLPVADGNVLVVIVEVSSADFATGVRWAARQPWIDVISLSAGVLANAPVTFSPIGETTGMDNASREADLHHKPIFMASGNGFSDTGIPPDHCSTYTSEYTGPEWVTRIGAAEPVSGDPTWWHCTPVDIIARTDVSSTDANSTSSTSDASGTSAATPNAVGHLAALVQNAREAGLAISAQDALPYLEHAAQPAPLQPGFGRDPSVPPASTADQGYGFVDGAALARAEHDLLVAGAPAPRPELDAWFAADHALRVSLWGPGSATDDHVDPLLSSSPSVPLPAVPNPVPGNDAGSGRDAGDTLDTAVPVLPGRLYNGSGQGVTDVYDDYSFAARAGQTLKFSLSGPGECANLIAPDGSKTSVGCDFVAVGVGGELGRTLSQSGTWRLEVESDVAGVYQFGFTLDGSAPPAASFLGAIPDGLLP